MSLMYKGLRGGNIPEFRTFVILLHSLTAQNMI